MKIISGVYWDKGRRKENQDSLMLEQVYTVRGRVLLAVISDGIGGLKEGETASGIVIEKLRQSFYQEILTLIGRGRGMKAVERGFLRCFYEMNQILNGYGKSREIRLGATVSLLFIWNRHYLLMHLGDSRIYQIQRKKDREWKKIRNRNGITAGKESGRQKESGRENVMKLSNDHSDEAGRLTKCMGSFAYQYPDSKKGKIKRNTGFLLCTDGFYHFVTEKMLGGIFEPVEFVEGEQIEKRLKELAGYAGKQGEKDNISAVYFACR